MNLSVKPKTVVKTIAVITLLVYLMPLVSEALLRTVGRTYGLVLFDVDYPRNIPAIYNVFLTLSAALLALLIAFFTRDNWKLRFGWFAVAGIAGFLAIDKGTGLSTYLSRETINQIFHLNEYPFLATYAVIGLIGAAIAWQIGKAFPFRTRRFLLVWLAVKAFGLVGLWLVSGYYAHWVTTENFVYAFLSTLEEATETFSTVILLFGLLDYLSLYLPTFNLSIENEEQIINPTSNYSPVITQQENLSSRP
ncbi:MAG: hypothetical protein AAF490_06885 [Chloroflexota bacterium]